MISAIKGYKFIAVMPESMSPEKREMIASFGGKIILTPAKDDVTGAIKKYRELIRKYKNVWLPKQFENSDNFIAHQNGLAQEIIKEMNNQVDVFVAGVGTGGTLIGVAKALREKNLKTKIIAVEPAESAVLSGRKPNLHKIQGIGEGFIPKLVKDNMDLIGEVIRIKSQDAIEMKKN